MFATDYFACDRSRKCKTFYAKFGSGKSMVIDAFRVDWSCGCGNFHPPDGSI